MHYIIVPLTSSLLKNTLKEMYTSGSCRRASLLPYLKPTALALYTHGRLSRPLHMHNPNTHACSLAIRSSCLLLVHSKLNSKESLKGDASVVIIASLELFADNARQGNPQIWLLWPAPYLREKPFLFPFSSMGRPCSMRCFFSSSSARWRSS